MGFSLRNFLKEIANAREKVHYVHCVLTMDSQTRVFYLTAIG